MGLGLPGAALATAVSPVLSIAICSRHFFKKSSTVRLVRQLPSPKLLAQSCQLGVSGFVGEMSSGVTTTVFNLLLLRLAGNVAVAAYGVVANYALVATAIFNGVAQGAQPLVSKCYGKNDAAGARKLLLLGSGTALALAAALYAVLFGFTGPIVAVFNSENSASWRSMPSAGCASTSSAISSRASISWPPAIWARWTAPQRLLRRRFPAASWHRGLLSGAERPLRDERRLGRVPGF